MKEPFILSPRYRLDDQSPWLEGIDPTRNYWIAVNGEKSLTMAIPGLTVTSLQEWKQAILKFRALKSGEKMEIERVMEGCTIHCISSNCYGVEIANAPVWHLFDQETLETLLRSSHPDWQPSRKDVEIGRKILSRSFEQPVYA